MAISNLPYDDDVIVEGLKNYPVQTKTVSGVTVDFTSNDLTPDATATVTATISWVISAPDAVELLEAALPAPGAAPDLPDGSVL